MSSPALLTFHSYPADRASRGRVENAWPRAGLDARMDAYLALS